MKDVSVSVENYQFLESHSNERRDVTKTLNDLLDSWRENLDEFRHFIEERYREIQAGEYTDYDDESLKEFFRELEAIADEAASESAQP